MSFQQRSGSLAIAIAVVTTALIPSLQATAVPKVVSGRPPAIAQQPALPFPLNGKPVYVRRGSQWQEALLVGYAWNSQTGVRYDVKYVRDGNTEKGVGVERIKSLETAQKQGTATTVYDLSSQAGIQQMLNAHNNWRKKTRVPALTWSPQLAAYAQQWATKLLQENRFEHRSNSRYGENLAAASGQQLSPERVVKMWGDEVKDYNYATNTCKPGKVCGHYTQVVWRKTQQVGCGMARGNGREVWVCNYNPPGNYVGQKPY
jgi:uncharacterized protein YkwD